MENVDALAREIKVLVFDQYGTVVDMQQGLVDAVSTFLKDKGWDGEPHRFVTCDEPVWFSIPAFIL